MTFFVDCNLNRLCRVKLTRYGIERYKAKMAIVPTLVDKEPDLDSDGYYRTQLHSLMEMFGDMLSLGNAKLPFDTEIQIDIDDK